MKILKKEDDKNFLKINEESNETNSNTITSLSEKNEYS